MDFLLDLPKLKLDLRLVFVRANPTSKSKAGLAQLDLLDWPASKSVLNLTNPSSIFQFNLDWSI